MDEDTKRLVEGVVERIEGMYDLINKWTPDAGAAAAVLAQTRVLVGRAA